MEGFRGTLAGVSLLDLIQFLCTSGAQIRLKVSSPEGEEGIICISDGRILHAETSKLEGEEAFFEIARWRQGEFRSTPLIGEWRNKLTISNDWQYLVLEAARARDEAVSRGDVRPADKEEYIIAYCQKCNKRFYVPASKVPFGSKVLVKCPSCKAEIPVEREEPIKDFFEAEIEKWKYEELEEGTPFLDISAGVLICTNDHELGKHLETLLQKEGDQIHLVNKGRDGFFALRQGDFSFVVIDEALGGGPEKNVLLYYLQRLPMNIRRKFYVCLLSQELRTRDFWAAFRLGVDLVINKNNVDLIGELLHYTTARLRKFYEPFLEELQILKAE